jgi:hypothetical protein
MKTFNAKIEQWAIDKVIPYANNTKKHPEKQIDTLASMISEYGHDVPIVVDNNGIIIKGHGRLAACKKLNMKTVPVIVRDDLTPAQCKAARIADNKISESEWDMDILKIELEELNSLDFDIDLTGFDDFDFSVDDELTDGLTDEKYTMKTDVFTYEPTGDKPQIAELYENKKVNELLGQIEKADIPEDIKLFLRLGAYRHIVFDFGKIANYYAHSNVEIQQLMENSAMIIIDYNDAISGGFVQLTKELQALVAEND